MSERGGVLAGLRSLRSLGYRLKTIIRDYPDLVANQAALGTFLAALPTDQFRVPCRDQPLTSRACRQADCGAEYAAWLDRLGLDRVFSRKYWEYTAIARALEAAGMLADGRRGVGFGVGREPLVAAMAVRGCVVVATDLDAGDPRAASWAGTDQHALSLAGMQQPTVCSSEVLARQVEVRAVDMTAIPSDLTGFDFCWSTCALEHLGTIDAGLRFIEASLSCLRPGGIAVHTTELNLDSNDATLASGPTVVYRGRDFEALQARVAALGHCLEPFAVGPPEGVLDRLVDIPPYQYASLLVRIGKYRATSAVLVLRAGDTA